MNSHGQEPIVAAMSGGVDSSAAAALLAERRPGAVVGMTMQLWDQRRLAERSDGSVGLPVVHAGRCCSLDDAYDARRVAEHLGLPYYLVNFEPRFEATVVRPFVESYLAGETPIPCTLCNNYIKFEELLSTAKKIGAERVATGHYARACFNDATGRHEMRRAADTSKDQSYFLFGLTQEQLARTEFPLGGMTKEEVRALAAERNLPVANKAESQEICFVPSGNYIGFIEAYLGEQGRSLPQGKGEIVSTDGAVLGAHHGLHQFTVGQRRGLGLATGKALYVVALDRKNNRLVVGEEGELYSTEVRAREPNWISIAAPTAPVRAAVKVRHRHQPARATLYPEQNGSAGSVRIVFDTPQRALTPGQAAVFYAPTDAPDPDLVLGGAWLC
jgi:tRNA-specific 2-thiouridylase